MKRKYINLRNLSLLLLFACFIARCTDYDVKGDTSFYDNISIKIAGLENDTLKVNVSNEQQITLVVSDEKVVFNMRSFIYHIEDTTVLKIDEAGNIKPVNPGITKMNMVFRANPKVTTGCIIKVWKEKIFVERIVVPASFGIKLGAPFNLAEKVVVAPSNADNRIVKYESLTPGIITVNEAGMITPVAEGEGEIKISATDKSGVTATCKVIVQAEIKVSDVKLPDGIDNRTIGMGQTVNLGSRIVVSPANADNRKLNYTIVSGEGVVTINEEGLITTVKPGKVVIRIATTDGTGITKEITLNVDNNPLIDRIFWSVTTQTATNYGHVTDNNTGRPEHLFDGDGKTFLSLVKPGKSFGQIPSQSAAFIPSFTVDMQSRQTFNYFTWRHRQGNNVNFLRVYGVKIEGSDNGDTFTPLNNDDITWIPNLSGYEGNVSKADNTTYSIDVPLSSYRYVRVKLVMWSDIYKGQHPDYAGNGATLGSTMQVAEFGLGKK